MPLARNYNTDNEPGQRVPGSGNKPKVPTTKPPVTAPPPPPSNPAEPAAPRESSTGGQASTQEGGGASSTFADIGDSFWQWMSSKEWRDPTEAKIPMKGGYFNNALKEKGITPDEIEKMQTQRFDAGGTLRGNNEIDKRFTFRALRLAGGKSGSTHNYFWKDDYRDELAAIYASGSTPFEWLVNAWAQNTIDNRPKREAEKIAEQAKEEAKNAPDPVPGPLTPLPGLPPLPGQPSPANPMNPLPSNPAPSMPGLPPPASTSNMNAVLVAVGAGLGVYVISKLV